MRLLILSESINYIQQFGNEKFTRPDDVFLAAINLNNSEGIRNSIFDYDVSIIHITPGRHDSTVGYYRNLTKVALDAKIALEHGRSVICLPESINFYASNYRDRGEAVYKWLESFGVILKSNQGYDIKPSGAGRAHIIQEYLKLTGAYYQIVIKPEIKPEHRLAVVNDTEIVVGCEYPVSKGTLIILPPPILNSDYYISSMSSLVDVARRYYERAQRRIPMGDAPDWIQDHLVHDAINLNQQIENLTEKKSRFDKIAYVLYGTGEELEINVAVLLEELGLKVELQKPGANIDLKANNSVLDIGFAIEVTGTKGVIGKDSNKISQAWQYLNDRSGTTQEKDRLVIVANTEYHLEPTKRKNNSFTPEVVKLLGKNGVLLLTTLQLYEQWKAVYKGKKSKEDVIKEIYEHHGLYKPK